MLVLTRKLGESIQIGDDIIVTVLRIKGNSIRLGIDAPTQVRIIRREMESFSKRVERVVHPRPDVAERVRGSGHGSHEEKLSAEWFEAMKWAANENTTVG